MRPDLESVTTTARLDVRKLVEQDAETMYRYRSHPEICRYQSWEPESLDEVREFVRRQAAVELGPPGTWFQLGLYLRETGELVGDVGIQVLGDEPRQAEIGITLAPEHHGRGLATEALRAVLGELFERRGMHRVFGSVDPDNAASIALLERIGMRREAHFLESLWFKGAWADDVVYAILRREHEGRGT